MDTPTPEARPEPDYTPRPNPITDTPATPADCARDYATAAAVAVRAELDKQRTR